MADYGMCYNGSGYKDETAYRAIMGAAKPGDIWTEGDRLVLIIKNQGSFVNCLTLREENKHSRMIEIFSAKAFYTDPGMLKHVHCEHLGQFVQRIPRDEFARVRDEVASALGFAVVKEKTRQEMCHELLDRILDRTGAK